LTDPVWGHKQLLFPTHCPPTYIDWGCGWKGKLSNVWSLSLWRPNFTYIKYVYVLLYVHIYICIYGEWRHINGNWTSLQSQPQP
jgi:hypothetical protein